MDNRSLTEIDESVFDVLAVIRRKPPLYLGARSLSRLHGFLGGYESGLGKLKGMWKDQKTWDGFHSWVAQRLNFASSTRGWCNMILDRSQTEEDGFDLFFTLLDEFKAQHGID